MKQPDPVALSRLARLCALVRRWNDAIRLVSRNDCAVLEARHIANCLAQLPLIEHLQPRSILDIGSGAGFPGLVIAITTALPIQLVEADRRKAEFLREAIRSLGLTATVHAIRAEMIQSKVDLVTARAVAPLTQLWPLACPLLSPGGAALFLKGESAGAEMREAIAPGLLWSMPNATIVEMHAPR